MMKNKEKQKDVDENRRRRKRWMRKGEGAGGECETKEVVEETGRREGGGGCGGKQEKGRII